MFQHDESTSINANCRHLRKYRSLHAEYACHTLQYANMQQLQVQDISGGCGSMYAIEIESPKFQGLTVIKQHKLVNQVLKEEIAQWHGVQLRTKVA
jgi:stress-induced morphogen